MFDMILASLTALGVYNLLARFNFEKYFKEPDSEIDKLVKIQNNNNKKRT